MLRRAYGRELLSNLLKMFTFGEIILAELSEGSCRRKSGESGESGQKRETSGVSQKAYLSSIPDVRAKSKCPAGIGCPSFFCKGCGHVLISRHSFLFVQLCI
jgi:hypothetical protein